MSPFKNKITSILEGTTVDYPPCLQTGAFSELDKGKQARVAKLKLAKLISKSKNTDFLHHYLQPGFSFGFPKLYLSTVILSILEAK